MEKQSAPVEQAKPRRGRPEVKGDDKILSNGLTARQWAWIQREAANKVPPVDAAWYQRFVVQTYIDGVEASRADIREIVAPRDDEQFESLVKSTSRKSNKSNKEK